ncbi:RraA family protein [Thiosulfatihalobacter marinus]|uniref:RraA family protein n=1 Tax=Thiosulfatihalobacter marinus TaxID=2792481 RepID=UPI0018D723CD|nr:RraA family protein [Thiosulfatihalobacter marinus]
MTNATTLTDRLENCYSGAIYDVMRAMGRQNCVLPHDIVGLDAETRCCGPVFTLRGVAFDTERANPETDYLLPWVQFLSDAPAGHVVICQPNSPSLALMGELSAETLKYRGIRGYVVDGGSRDNAFIRKIGFPVFCKFRTPRDIVGKWVPDATGEPITIGDVLIRNGDYVLADFDGVVIIPAEIAQAVVTEVENVMTAEDKVRAAILSGTDPVDAYLEHGKF